jgi:hypothetical protein
MRLRPIEQVVPKIAAALKELDAERLACDTTVEAFEG